MSKLTVAGIGLGEADYILPAVIEKMKKNPRISNIPIVILSSVTTVSSLNSIENPSLIKSFVKPISLMEYSVLADKIVQTIQ